MKDEVGGLHADWEYFRKTIPDTAAPEQLPDLVSKAKDLTAPLRTYGNKVYDRLHSGDWLGWLFPTLVEHMTAELDHFVSSISEERRPGLPGVADELCFWLRHNSEESAFAAHLLDPRENVLIKQAHAFTEKFEDLLEGCKSVEHGFIVLSEKAGQLFDHYLSSNGIGTPQVSSVIHPVLALHVLREVRMSRNVMTELRGRGSSVEVPE